MVSDLAATARRLVGGSAEVSERTAGEFAPPMWDVLPSNDNAFRISVIGVDAMVLHVGTAACRWELGYEADDVAFATRVMEAVIAGRAEERHGLSRTHLAVMLLDGTVETTSVYDGCLSALLPQPGWRRNGRFVRAAPYRPEDGSSARIV